MLSPVENGVQGFSVLMNSSISQALDSSSTSW